MAAVNRRGFEKDLISEVLPVVDRKYRVLTGPANRAIVGFSMGGGEAMSTILHHLEIFGYIGSFSGVTNYRAELEKMGAPALNRYRLIWLGCGTEDSLYGANKTVAEWMDKNDVHHTFRSIPGAHVWPVWHKFPAELAPPLFMARGK